MGRRDLDKDTSRVDVSILGDRKKVRRKSNTMSPTEAIEKALPKNLNDREIRESLDKLLRKGRFRTIYE